MAKILIAVVVAVMLGVVLSQKDDLIIPVDIDAMNLEEPDHVDDRTLVISFSTYTSCASTKNCTNTNYYCGYALLLGYRCFPKKCFGLCVSSSQCSTGVCSGLFCKSCLG